MFTGIHLIRQPSMYCNIRKTTYKNHKINLKFDTLRPRYTLQRFTFITYLSKMLIIFSSALLTVHDLLPCIGSGSTKYYIGIILFIEWKDWSKYIERPYRQRLISVISHRISELVLLLAIIFDPKYMIEYRPKTHESFQLFIILLYYQL